MKNVYYVQRLNAPRNPTPFDFGGGILNGGISKEAMSIIKNIFSFDYMGSAEFEWGAVPTALDALSKLDLETSVVGKIYIIAPKSILSDVEEWVKTASKEHLRLKERLNLKQALANDKYAQTKGWLKIEDDKYCEEPFMFFIDEEMFKKTCSLFEI